MDGLLDGHKVLLEQLLNGLILSARSESSLKRRCIDPSTEPPAFCLDFILWQNVIDDIN